jgi:hypothetical protein
VERPHQAQRKVKVTLAPGKAISSFPELTCSYTFEREEHCMANKEQKQKKEQKAGPKSNKQKKEAAREKKAAKASKTL